MCVKLSHFSPCDSPDDPVLGEDDDDGCSSVRESESLLERRKNRTHRTWQEGTTVKNYNILGPPLSLLFAFIRENTEVL